MDGDDPPEGETPSTRESRVERAKELQAQLVALRLRERTANFEDREAIRRAIRRKERELESLGVDPDELDGDDGQDDDGHDDDGHDGDGHDRSGR